MPGPLVIRVPEQFHVAYVPERVPICYVPELVHVAYFPEQVPVCYVPKQVPVAYFSKRAPSGMSTPALAEWVGSVGWCAAPAVPPQASSLSGPAKVSLSLGAGEGESGGGGGGGGSNMTTMASGAVSNSNCIWRGKVF
ncbi:hypothetical protein DPEC_G00044080 [Dallia pectoralis]|uniref:Uncharacterized protein n=1 Tax=Dallia pectoralis TaxID=75939 RepID=A0ACC2H9I3_DALPE|nr:hypothetical protein DPEC_G00044080 [Dallia pectoralis]